jgi:hypothetical protein
VVLDWATANESNHRDYEVERSSDGIAFHTVKALPSENNPNGAIYQYTDNLGSAGTYFYRLKMTDIDGRFEYAAVQQVNVQCGLSGISVSPNPAISEIIIKGLQTTEQIAIMDISGKILISRKAGASILPIDISGLSSGIYFIRVTRNGIKMHEQKFVKLH